MLLRIFPFLVQRLLTLFLFFLFFTFSFLFFHFCLHTRRDLAKCLRLDNVFCVSGDNEVSSEQRCIVIAYELWLFSRYFLLFLFFSSLSFPFLSFFVFSSCNNARPCSKGVSLSLKKWGMILRRRRLSKLAWHEFTCITHAVK